MKQRNHPPEELCLLPDTPPLSPRLWAPDTQAPQPFHSAPLCCVTSVKSPLLSELVFCSYDEGAMLGEHSGLLRHLLLWMEISWFATVRHEGTKYGKWHLKAYWGPWN